MDTFQQNTYCINSEKQELEWYVLEDNNSRIERTYFNKSIQKIITYRLGKLYETRQYIYSPDGELDTLLITSDNKTEIIKRTLGNFKKYSIDTSVLVYKKNNVVTKIVNRQNKETYKIYYKNSKIQKIVVLDSNSGQQIGETIFDENELVVSTTNKNENFKENNIYTFDAKKRWTKRERIINGKILTIITREYIDN